MPVGLSSDDAGAAGAVQSLEQREMRAASRGRPVYAHETTPLQRSGRRTEGHHRVARVWVVLTGGLLALAVLLILVSLVPYYLRLSVPCPDLGPCSGSSITVGEAAALARYGVSIQLYASIVFTIQIVTTLGLLGIATLLFWRRRDDPMALCTAAAFALLAVEMPGYLGAVVDDLGWYKLLLTLLHAATVGSIILFYALFPTGTFVPSVLRWYAPLLIALYGLAVLFASVLSSPILSYQLVLAAQTLALGSMVVAQCYRYARHSSPEQRRQTRWLLACALTYTSYRLGSAWFFLMAGIVGDEQRLVLNITLIALLHVLELAIVYGTVVTLRRGLYQLDRLLGRTIVYALLTLSVVVLYVLIVGGLSLLLQPASNALLTLVATGVIALAVQPLRDALQRGVNRLLYGRRDDPREVIAALGRKLEGALAADVVLPTIVQTLARELKLPYAAVVLDGRDDPAAASVGVPVEPLLILPLSDGGIVIGRLFVAARSPDEPFTADERRLLEDLARQAGVAARAARLNQQLQRSRERLVAAREEERRRLQRDLHDELGPTLASMSMQLDAAQGLLREDPASSEALLAEVRAQLKETVVTVRQIVHKLRPPLLDQLGLIGAIRECALRVERSTGILVSLDLPQALPPLSAAVEAATYYIVAEALNNTARHAGARGCIVRLAVGTALLIEVVDDGIGMPAAAVAGVGLRSMRERAEELGGTWEIVAVAGGVAIRVNMPLAAPSV